MTDLFFFFVTGSSYNPSFDYGSKGVAEVFRSGSRGRPAPSSASKLCCWYIDIPRLSSSFLIKKINQIISSFFRRLTNVNTVSWLSFPIRNLEVDSGFRETSEDVRISILLTHTQGFFRKKLQVFPIRKSTTCVPSRTFVWKASIQFSESEFLIRKS